MMWQLLAIWVIVLSTIVWFIRDERHERRRRQEVRARYYATAPAYRHRSPAAVYPATLVPVDTRGLDEAQRKFFEIWSRRD